MGVKYIDRLCVLLSYSYLLTIRRRKQELFTYKTRHVFMYKLKGNCFRNNVFAYLAKGMSVRMKI